MNNAQTTVDEHISIFTGGWCRGSAAAPATGPATATAEHVTIGISIFNIMKEPPRFQERVEYYEGMSWFRTVFGIIGEAVGTDAGREVISKVGAAIRKDTSQPPLSLTDVECLIANCRTETNESLEAIVAELNIQNMKLIETVRRQRVWNIALASGVVAAVLIAFLT